MPAAVLYRGGPRLYFVDLPVQGSERIRPLEVRLTPGSIVHASTITLPSALLATLRERDAIGCAQPEVERLLRSIGLRSFEVAPDELRELRRRIPAEAQSDERRFLLSLAREAAMARLESPEERLIALAREEERVERALLRESAAAKEFLTIESGDAADYAREWTEFRRIFTAHHRALLERLETAARTVAPNLSLVVGERVAARLVARAPGLAMLGRISASRLQLLGTRRRPDPVRGPRFGILYGGRRMEEVPPDRQAAYARSLAALAVIAARADAATHRPIAAGLVARRDRRIEQLRGSR